MLIANMLQTAERSINEFLYHLITTYTDLPLNLYVCLSVCRFKFVSHFVCLPTFVFHFQQCAHILNHTLESTHLVLLSCCFSCCCCYDFLLRRLPILWEPKPSTPLTLPRHTNSHSNFYTSSRTTKHQVCSHRVQNRQTDNVSYSAVVIKKKVTLSPSFSTSRSPPETHLDHRTGNNWHQEISKQKYLQY